MIFHKDIPQTATIKYMMNAALALKARLDDMHDNAL